MRNYRSIAYRNGSFCDRLQSTCESPTTPSGTYSATSDGKRQADRYGQMDEKMPDQRLQDGLHDDRQAAETGVMANRLPVAKADLAPFPCG